MLLFDNKNKNYICKKCNSVLLYCEEYDTYYCPKCDEWSEEKCGDPDCYFCNERPEKPSDAIENE